MTWAPILSRDSELGAQAWDAIRAIANAVVNKDYLIIDPEKHPFRTYEAALLYAYLAVALDDPEWAIRATECLNQAIDQAPQLGYLDLFGGLTGLAWTVEHVSHLLQQVSGSVENPEAESASEPEGSGEEEEDLNAEVDAAILRSLPKMNSSSPYDLISGLVGFGTYFLERLPRRSATQGVKAVFAQLENLAQQVNGTATWYSGPDLLPAWQREQCPSGYYNLGVAHGIPGIIHFLSEVTATDIIDQSRPHKLLEGAVGWLFAQQRPSGSQSRFAPWVVPGEELKDSRMTWCYGDLGILSVLLQVAHRTGRRDWRGFAEDLLNHCLAWPPDRTGIADAPLCHGAAGVAYIFNRIYQTEGDPRCRDAALLWYQRTMAFRQIGTGVGGFSLLTRPDLSAPSVWEASPAFLDGATGVALAFLAAVTSIEPSWDRMLLLSGRTFRPH